VGNLNHAGKRRENYFINGPDKRREKESRVKPKRVWEKGRKHQPTAIQESGGVPARGERRHGVYPASVGGV